MCVGRWRGVALAFYRSNKKSRIDRPFPPSFQCSLASFVAGASLQRVEVGTLERAVKLSNKDAKLTKEHLQPLQVRKGEGVWLYRPAHALTHTLHTDTKPRQLLFRRAELTVLGVSKELDKVRQREAALRETSGACMRRSASCHGVTAEK